MNDAPSWLVASGVVCLILLLFYRKARTPDPIEVDDDPAQPYSAYTTEFDIEARAVEVADALEALPRSGRVFSRAMADNNWPSRVISSEKVYEAASTAPLRLWLAETGSDTAIVWLVDLSGSMANTIVQLSGELRKCCNEADLAGIPTALLGFTTLGWRGGQSRQKWLAAGSPIRPGRLCDLLHVTFKPFDAPLKLDEWRTLLHPGLLCENVDGEALEWAAELLKARPERRKILVVLSDGASVDDSTLIANGAGFLERHLKSVIAKLEQDNSLQIGAIGIGFCVEQYYSNSVELDEDGSLAESLRNLLMQLGKDGQA